MSILRQGPGVFFAFAAFVLLIFVSVSAPTWRAIYFLEAETNGVQLRFGNWGYVVRAVGGDWQSSGARLGYNAEAAVEQFGQLGDISGSVVRNLTYTLILHPIAAAITLIAILISLTTNVILDTIGSLVSFFAFLVCLVALICDSILFVVARNRINRDVAGSPASLSNAYWMVVAATILLLLAAFTVCFGSRHARKEKRRNKEADRISSNSTYGNPTAVDAYGNPVVPVDTYGTPLQEKRRFWQRSPRY